MKRTNVLIVDDDRLLVCVCARGLEQAGISAVCAYGGARALELFAEAPDRFDVVLLDIVMPGMGGGEVMKKMRAIKPDARIILMSGCDHERLEHSNTGAPPTAFIDKPFEPEELTAAIERALSPPMRG